MPSEFAPGLPSKEKIHPIDQKGKTRLVIQQHKASHDHFDVRLQSGDVAHSWVMRSLPGEKKKALMIRQPSHTSDYMNFEGKIEKGYGAGTVKKVVDVKADITSATNDKIKMKLPQGNFTMIRPKGFKDDKHWLMIKNSNLGRNMFEQIKEAAMVDELEKIAISFDVVQKSALKRILSTAPKGSKTAEQFKKSVMPKINSASSGARISPKKGLKDVAAANALFPKGKKFTEREFQNALTTASRL